MRTSLLAVHLLALTGCGPSESPAGPSGKPSHDLVRAIQAELPEGAVVDRDLVVWYRDAAVEFPTAEAADATWHWKAWTTTPEGVRPFPPNTGTVTADNRVSGCDFVRAAEACRATHPGFRRAVSGPSPEPTAAEESLKNAVAARMTWCDVLAVVMPRQGRKGVAAVRNKDAARADDIAAVWFDADAAGTWRTDGWWKPYAWDTKNPEASRSHWVWWGRHECPPDGPMSLKLVDHWPPTEEAKRSAVAATEHKLADVVREHLRGRR